MPNHLIPYQSKFHQLTRDITKTEKVLCRLCEFLDGKTLLYCHVRGNLLMAGVIVLVTGQGQLEYLHIKHDSQYCIKFNSDKNFYYLFSFAITLGSGALFISAINLDVFLCSIPRWYLHDGPSEKRKRGHGLQFCLLTSVDTNYPMQFMLSINNLVQNMPTYPHKEKYLKSCLSNMLMSEWDRSIKSLRKPHTNLTFD